MLSPLPLRVGLISVLAIASVLHAAAENGRITRDVQVGPSDHPVTLKSGTTVKLLSIGAAKEVVGVDFPDGSSGIYQVDPSVVERIAPPPVAAPPVVPAANVISTANTNKPASSAPGDAKTAPPASAGPPDFDKALIGGPEFNTAAGTQSAGTACLAKLKDSDQCYILTARHLLGPNGGFEKETPLDQVPDFVKGIRFYSFDEKDHYYTAKGLLIQADPEDKTDLWGDVSIFAINNGPDKPLLLPTNHLRLEIPCGSWRMCEAGCQQARSCTARGFRRLIPNTSRRYSTMTISSPPVPAARRY